MATRENLLRWQWQTYDEAHRDRRNLILHALSAPLFIGATITVPIAALFGRWALAAGALGTALGVLAIQGAGHRLEANAPAPFLGPLDVVMRFVAEQWITFPRFVLSGQLARSWRHGRERPGASNARP
jgi:hypothetical protein